MKINIHKKNPSFIIIIFLVFTTLAVYWQILNHEFVNFDDNIYITKNLNVQTGLSVKGVIWAFTTNHTGNWHPLTWLSHMLDCNIYGLNPGGHHLTSLLFHIINTILLFLVFKGMTDTLWRSAFVATLFALHPIHVESVAWVSERKDVLSTFFWILTVWAYVGYIRRPGLNKYLIILLFFILGLLSKQMLVTLPFVLLLLDYWPLGRIVNSTHGLQQTILYLVREKIPFFVLAVVFSIVIFFVQKSTENVMSLKSFILKERITNALFSYASYIGKMLWPQHLVVFYPHPGGSLSVWQYVGAGLLLFCISLLVFWKIRRHPYFLVGWLWYIGTLIPVVGIVQVGSQSMADRYTYIPHIGISIIIAWGVHEFVLLWSHKKIWITTLVIMIIPALIAVTWKQIQYWQNTITLFKHALDVDNRNLMARYILGNTFAEQEKYDQAISNYKEALRLNPDFAEVHNNLGNVLNKLNKFDEAIFHYKEALRNKPNLTKAHVSMGNVSGKLNKFDEAIFHYKKVLQINPEHVEAHYNLGTVLSRHGKHQEAIKHFSEVLRINPNHEEAHNNLGNVLSLQEKYNDAIFHYKEVLQVNPNHFKAHNNLGLVFAGKGNFNEAIAHISEALRIKPGFDEAKKNLRIILKKAENKNEIKKIITH